MLKDNQLITYTLEGSKLYSAKIVNDVIYASGTMDNEGIITVFNSTGSGEAKLLILQNSSTLYDVIFTDSIYAVGYVKKNDKYYALMILNETARIFECGIGCFFRSVIESDNNFYIAGSIYRIKGVEANYDIIIAELNTNGSMNAYVISTDSDTYVSGLTALDDLIIVAYRGVNKVGFMFIDLPKKTYLEFYVQDSADSSVFIYDSSYYVIIYNSDNGAYTLVYDVQLSKVNRCYLGNQLLTPLAIKDNILYLYVVDSGNLMRFSLNHEKCSDTEVHESSGTLQNISLNQLQSFIEINEVLTTIEVSIESLSSTTLTQETTSSNTTWTPPDYWREQGRLSLPNPLYLIIGFALILFYFIGRRKTQI
jgi:hypothetical protein